MKSVALTFESAREIPSRVRSSTAARLPSFDYLRAFVIALVVWHHAMMAYCTAGHAGQGGDFTTATAPVVDGAQWTGFNLMVSWNDGFFMPLMFLLAGLFVRPSLARKGLGPYLADRARRLGVPLVVGILTVVPLSYYATYLQSGGTAGFGAFWRHMVTAGPWPSGPMWFVGVLLVFDGATVLVLAAVGDRWPALPARVRPLRSSAVSWFLVFLAGSALAYMPLGTVVGASQWLTFGPFGVQESRIGLYGFYFAAGVIVGADRLAGAFADKWLRWPVVAALATALYFALPEQLGDVVSDAALVVFSAAMAIGLLALAVRFGRRRSAVGDSLGASAYGIYLLHYPIVLWLQYALLRARLDAEAKALIVMVLGFGLSWLGAGLLRRLPGVARFV